MVVLVKSDANIDADLKGVTRDTIKENVVQVKRLRKSLEEWREVLAPLHGVLIWREDYHPAALSSVVTLLFLLVWYLDPPVLTLVSAVGFIVTLADYLVPAVCQGIFRQEDWTATKEREFERCCQLISDVTSSVQDCWDTLVRWKHEKPKMYIASVLMLLFVLAWLGNSFNNLFLTYLMVLFVVLYPGMRHRGLLKKYLAEIILFITSKLRSNRTQPPDASRPKSE